MKRITNEVFFLLALCSIFVSCLTESEKTTEKLTEIELQIKQEADLIRQLEKKYGTYRLSGYEDSTEEYLEFDFNRNRLTLTRKIGGRVSHIKIESQEKNEWPFIQEVSGFTKVDNLWLEGKYHTSLPEGLSEFVQLKELWCKCQLSKLPLFFTKLKMLESLTLSPVLRMKGAIQLTDFPIVLCQLPELKHLDLDFNPIDSLPNELSEMRLQKLSLNYTKINEFPSVLTKMPYLKDLRLSSDNLELTTEIGNLQVIETLIIEAKGNLPESVGDLTSLKDLSVTGVDNIPISISKLKKLNRLDLLNLKIKYLPNDLFKLTELKKLRIKDCKITNVPPSIGDLTNLTELEISNTQVKKLPSEIGKLKKLESLSLNFNQLRSLPEEIGNLENIVYVDVSFNRLRKLPETVGNWKKIEQFYGQQNNWQGDFPSKLYENYKLNKFNSQPTLQSSLNKK